MSFAYIEGKEAQALEFYETQLAQCTDSKLRPNLEEFVKRLRKIVAEKKQSPAPSISNSFSLRYAGA